MSLVAMAQRRKPTTYGKASRKPMIAAGAAFAQVATADTRNSYEQLEDRNEFRAFTSDYLEEAGASSTLLEQLGNRASSSGSRPERHNGLISKHKHSPSLSSSVSSIADGVFDFPSSDDDTRSKISATDGLARKKRKLTPNLVGEDTSSVFDDASLQRHIAAETQRELSPTQRFHSNAARSKGSSSLTSFSRRQDKERSSTPPTRNWAPKAAGILKENSVQAIMPQDVKAKEQTTARPRTIDHLQTIKPSMPVRKAQKIKGQISNVGGKDTANLSDKVLAGAIKAPKRLSKEQKADQQLSEVHVRPNTPENNPKTILAHRSALAHGDGTIPVKESFQSRTPPRSTKAIDTATTPRQRDLWNKLLLDDVHTASPSVLNLPGLMLTDKAKSLEEPPTVRKVTWSEDQHAIDKPRQKRLIDTLHSSAHDLSQSEDDGTDEDSEDSSNDDHSRSPQSESSVTNDALTVQTSPSAESQSRGQPLHQHNSSQSSQALPSLLGVGPKVTYARQRSYLTDHDLDEAAMISTPVVPVPVSLNGESRKGLNDRFHGSQSTSIYDDGDYGAAEDSQGGTMRSIHELREAGGNVRLVGELEALLDDLEEQKPVPTTLLRSRVITLVAKLQEPSTCRLFVDQGLETRLLAHVASHGDDLIANSLFAAAILELVSISTSPPLLAQISDARILSFLTRLLGREEDLVLTSKLRSFNLSKFVQLEYQRLCTLLLKSAAWRVGKPTILSCHILALQCLEYIVRQTREAGSSVEVLSAYAIQRIVATSVPSSSAAILLSSPTLTVNLELAVSILESCTARHAAECQQSLWSGDTLERVTGLLPRLVSWSEEGCAMSRTLTLRLYLNLTNNNPGLCEDFSTPGIVEALFRIIILNFEKLSDRAVTVEKVLLLNDLILSLGSFINIAESSDIVRKLTLNLHHGGQSFFDVLLTLFTIKSKSAAEVR